MNKLFAPVGYLDLTPLEKKGICNGMGAKDSALSALIPNTMWFLDVTEAGNIHDYMYYVGTTIADKEEADRVFMNNLMRLINNKGGWLSFLRRRRAMKYYEAVFYCGGDAFWEGKNGDV